MNENELTLKESKQSKLKIWFATLGVALFSGVLAIGSFFIEIYSKASAISYDDSSYEITLTESDWSLSYNNLYQYLMDNSSSLAGKIKASYLQEQEVDLSFSSGLTIIPYFNGQDLLGFGLDNKFVTTADLQDLEDGRLVNNIADDITFVVDSAFYSAFKTAISLDIPNSISQDGFLSILGELISLLTGGVIGVSGGIGNGVSTLVSDIFISNSALSVFGGIIVVFAGVSLAIGLCRWVMNFLTSLGAKK